MSLWPPAPAPNSRLGYYRVLAPSAGVRVSPLCLGTMNIGTAWSSVMGKVDKSTAFSIFNTYHTAGGNFIDCSNNYQDEQAEEWVGEWMEEKGVRDQMVICTKYSVLWPKEKDFDKAVMVNFGGNSTKSLKLSVAASLKKLRTSYIDVFYLHWWDYVTPVSEIMHSLHHLVVSGQVLYLGVADTPAWYLLSTLPAMSSLLTPVLQVGLEGQRIRSVTVSHTLCGLSGCLLCRSTGSGARDHSHVSIRRHGHCALWRSRRWKLQDSCPILRE